MPLQDLQLDNRRFEDLVQELRRRIPAYTPEWTDHNDSDPGMALIQLFAWLEDMLIWRLNQLPQRALIKFLQLVDIELTPPQPAQSELTFKLTSKDLPFAVPIDQGTQVGLASASDGPPVIFETTDNLYAVGAEIVAVQVFDGGRYQVVTETNRLSDQSYFAFSKVPQRNAALYLGFDRAFPAGDNSYPLTIHVGQSRETPVARGGDGSALDLEPPVLAVWEYWSGDQTRWQPLKVVEDQTSALLKSGVVRFEAPADWVLTKYGALKKSDDQPLFWLRYRIDQILGQGYEGAPRIVDVLVNTISAINAVTETAELLGASNGMPNQTFQISNVPILPKDQSVAGIIEVDEGDGSGFQLWSEVRDFANSDRTSTHYTLNYATGLVAFGDGEQGKIPRWLSDDASNREPADLPNIRVTKYRWGGGARGNAGVGSITSLERSIPFVDSVTNLVPSVNGADEETIEHAQGRAPSTIRTLSRAVTAEDFSFLAKQTPGGRIARAVALPLHRPGATLLRPASGSSPAIEVPMPGVVTVIVVPDVPDEPKPSPNQQTVSLVAQWLDKHRLLTCELYVVGPQYRQVEIEARVIVEPDAESGKVAEALRAALLAYFHPLSGGQKGTGWDFGQTIFLSETYGEILKIEGVQRIEGSVTTYLDGKRQPENADVPIGPNELVYSLKHTLDVRYAS
jgi:predicted phage baseplate assembly protein